MEQSATRDLGALLSARGDQILDAWMHALVETVSDEGKVPALSGLARVEMAGFIAKLSHFFEVDAGDVAGDAFAPLAAQAAQISASRARDGHTPVATANLVLALKGIIADLVLAHLSDDRHVGVIVAMNTVLDRLALVTFSSYVETRERLIERQSRALVDLATPVLPIWRHIVLMPLVGIIDTQRARQITEWLLEALAREEARVAIIDVTGVPIIDSRVALHLTKTVDAARLLGAKVVLTGFSADAAQTLVKLDVNLRGMITRGNLRAGLAEAFRLVGLSVAGDAGTGVS